MKVRDLAKIEAPDFGELELYKKITEIESRDQFEDLVGVALHAKAIYDKYEEERKELKAPSLEAGKRIDRKYKTVTAPLDGVIKHLRGLISRWEAENRECRAQRLLTSAQDTEHAKALMAVVQAEPAQEAMHENCTFRKGYEVEVLDISAVDPKYLLLDEKKLLQDHKLGIADVSGLLVKTAYSPILHVSKD